MSDEATSVDEGAPWQQLMVAALAYSRAVVTADFPSQSVILRNHQPDLLLLATSHLLFTFAGRGPCDDPNDPGLRLLLVADLLVAGADEMGGPLTAWTLRDRAASHEASPPTAAAPAPPTPTPTPETTTHQPDTSPPPRARRTPTYLELSMVLQLTCLVLLLALVVIQ